MMQKPTLINNIDSQWFQTLDVINRLVKEHETNVVVQSADLGQWKKTSLSNICENCQKAFGFFLHRHYCKLCRNVFCKTCLSFERRLNYESKPDSNGILFKVCKECFNEEIQTIGQTTNHLKLFVQFRENNDGQNMTRSRTQKNKNRIQIRLNNFRETLDFEKECHRLKDGFQECLKTSKNSIFLFPDILYLPEWKKSSVWAYANMATKCIECCEEFSLLKSRHNCVVCGSVVCSNCSSKDLLVYIPDDDDDDNIDKVCLSIIRIIGCPEKEPRICMYLRVCQTCHLKLQDQQITFEEEEERKRKDSTQEDDIMIEISKSNEKLKLLQVKIEESLPKYCELLNGLLCQSSVSYSKIPNQKTTQKSNMQLLAKAQGDLFDFFTNLVTTIIGMKKLKPKTKSQMTIHANVIKSKFDYYQEYMCQFRGLQRQLETVAPKDVLVAIQDVVNTNAINSCYLSIKQLALEVLHLSHKYHLELEILQKLVTAEEIAQKELRLMSTDNWLEQETMINKFLDIQLKEHRLIRPSKRLMRCYGERHVEVVVMERSEVLLEQIYLQLNAKSSDNKFLAMKLMIKEILSNCNHSQYLIGSETL